MIQIIAFLLLNLFITPEEWGANGHRIVADICERHLTDNAKKEIKSILGKEYLAEITNWPDYIKAEDEWGFAYEWHWTTVHPDQTVADVKAKYSKDEKINDAIEATYLMIDVLKGNAEATAYFDDLINKRKAKRLNNSTKATAMAFLVHLVGDIHQPLHVGKNRDNGGNKISVLYFKERSNIHAVWDTDIIEHERLSYTEFAYFINKLSNDEILRFQKDPLEKWAEESIILRERIYNTLYDYTDRETGLPSFSWNYQHDFLPEVEDRLVKAGVRLAGVLNEIYN